MSSTQEQQPVPIPQAVKAKPKFEFSWSWVSIPSLLVFWVLAVYFMDAFMFETRVIPQPWEVVDEFISMVQAPTNEHDTFYTKGGDEPKKYWYTLGSLGAHIWQSFKEVILGFVVAFIVALFLGFMAGFNRSFRDYITPLNGVFMSIPAIAWAPMLILMFEKFTAIVLVVYIAAVSPMIIAIMEGVLTIKGTEVRAARALGAKPRQLFIYVYLPASLPFITAGLRIGFSQAWRALVAAEMVGGIGIGLGHLVAMGDELGSNKVMMLGIVFIGMLSYIFERLVFRRIERHYEVWRLN